VCRGQQAGEPVGGALSGFWEHAQGGSWPIGLREHFSLNHAKIKIERELCKAGAVGAQHTRRVEQRGWLQRDSRIQLFKKNFKKTSGMQRAGMFALDRMGAKPSTASSRIHRRSGAVGFMGASIRGHEALTPPPTCSRGGGRLKDRGWHFDQEPRPSRLLRGHTRW